MLTHPKRRLCGPPDWNFIIRYRASGDKIQELRFICIDNPVTHLSIAKSISESCGFARVESIHKTPATADFVKKDYPLEVSYFENLY